VVHEGALSFASVLSFKTAIESQARVDVVKLDCEGSELDILEYCESWGAVRLVMAEYSTQRCRKWGVGNARFVATLKNMQKCGFTHAFIGDWMYENIHWTKEAWHRPGMDDNIWFYRKAYDDLDAHRESARGNECLLSEHLRRFGK
jgi:hypothetical protein